MSRTWNGTYTQQHHVASNEPEESSDSSSSVVSISSNSTSDTDSENSEKSGFVSLFNFAKGIWQRRTSFKPLESGIAQTSNSRNALASSSVGVHTNCRGEPGSSLSAGSNNISFECSVCLEFLDQPASVDRNHNVRALSFTDILVTHCGHIYHLVCLEKWFAEEGRRTCPSCRKPVPKSKCIRVYPNMSQDVTKKQSFKKKQNEASLVSMEDSSDPRSSKNTKRSEVIEGNRKMADSQKLKFLYKTKINENKVLQAKYNEAKYNDELKTATIRSLEDEVRRLKKQVRSQENLDENSANANSNVGKRRRKC